MSNKKKVLIISFSPIKSDPRVLRQVSSLKDNYLLTVAGYGDLQVVAKQEISIVQYRRNFYDKIRDSLLMLFGMSNIFYWRFNLEVKDLLQKIDGKKFDLIISNDFDALPAALHIAQDMPVFLDAHEYTPDQITDKSLKFDPLKKYRKWLVRKHISKVKKISTVGPRIAEKYSKKYKVSLPLLLPNMPRFANLEPKKPDPHKIKLVHHGVVSDARGIDTLIKSLEFVENKFELHLILLGERRRVDKIREIAYNNAQVFFHDPVDTLKIPFFLNQFDLGVFLLKPLSQSYLEALPNKFFEFVQARLGVIIGPSPEMARYVRQYGFGIIADGFAVQDLADQLNTLNSDTIWKFKKAAHSAAKELCWETFEPDLKDAVERLIK
jgi:hypothetical protein